MNYNNNRRPKIEGFIRRIKKRKISPITDEFLPTGICKLEDLTSLKYADVEESKRLIEERRKELRSMCNLKAPSIFNQTVIKISKKADVFIRFDKASQKDITTYSLYVEMCQIISDRYNGAKLRDMATIAQASTQDLKPRVKSEEFSFIEDSMQEEDVDSTEYRKHFNKQK